MKTDSRIYIAGRGLVGSALERSFTAAGYRNLLLPTHAELDLRNQAAVNRFFQQEKPEYVFHAAGRVGGILENTKHPADFIADNIAIALNVIEAAHQTGVEKLLFLSSSCAYPRQAPQPMKEEYLLTGPLEPTNEPYAIAKIAGIKLCEAYHRQHGDRFFSLMPTNLYGPNDNFDLQTSHVLPALIHKFHDAKLSGAATVTVWGSGAPRREFMHVDDLAKACLLLVDRLEGGQLVNIGTGTDVSIADLTHLIARVIGYEGTIVWDRSKPDGMPQKLLDVTQARELGWQAHISLEDGVRSVYEWFCSQPRATLAHLHG